MFNRLFSNYGIKLECSSQRCQGLWEKFRWSGYQENGIKIFACIIILSITSSAGAQDIFDAIKKGDSAKVQEFIRTGANVNKQDEDGETPLTLASSNGHTDIVKLLIANGADIDKQNNYGNTPLIWAVSNEYPEIVKLLIAKGADVNKQNNEGETALSYAFWVKSTDKDIIDQLYAAGATAPISKLGEVPFVPAIGKKQIDLAKIMFKKQYEIYEKNEEKTLQKNCFVTFNRYEDEPQIAITADIFNALYHKIIVISSLPMLYKVFNHGPFIKKYFQSNKLTLFVTKDRKLGVIIPEPSKSTNPQDLCKEYGFKELNFVQPNEIDGLFKDKNQEPFDILSNDFKQCIDVTSDQHPTRFYLIGHGDIGMVANMPTTYLEQLFTILNDIKTEFIYIVSCYGTGENTVNMQDTLQIIIDKQRKSTSESKIINYIIAIQATTDVSTQGLGNLRPFFKRLDEYFKPIGARTVSMDSVLKSLDIKEPTALMSVRFPGATTFFRAPYLGEMEIITTAKMRALRAAPILSPMLLNQRIKVLEKTKDEAKTDIDKKLASAEIEHIKLLMEETKRQSDKNKLIILPVKSDIKYIQIFLSNLSDCDFVIPENKDLLCISNIAGDSVHFIGNITYQLASNKSIEGSIEDIARWFTQLSPEYRVTNKAWFIKSVTVQVNGQNLFKLKKVVIFVQPKIYAVMYKDSKNYYTFDGQTTKQITEEQYIDTVEQWSSLSMPENRTLYEASAGSETLSNFPDLYKNFFGTKFDKKIIDVAMTEIREIINARAGISQAVYTPLLVAAQRGLKNIVEMRIKARENLNQQDSNGNTPLALASLHGHTEIANLLIDNRADINKQNNSGNTPLILAVNKGDADIAKLLIANGADVNKQNNDGFNALKFAAGYGHTEITKLLIDNKADVNKTDNKEGWTPLMTAVSKGHTGIAKLLIDRGADVNKKNNKGGTALMVAAESGHTDIVKLLLDYHADIDEKNDYDDTPLIEAASSGYIEIVKVLIAKGADINKQNKYGNTSLIMAVAHGHTDIAKLLIDRGADVNKQNNDGMTPLMLASDVGYLDIANLLIDNGAAIDKSNKIGDTAVRMASYSGHKEIVALLISKKADVNKANSLGKTPLSGAIGVGHKEIVELLIKNHANVNTSNNDGGTPLIVAAQFGHTEIAKLLIQNGADVNKTDNKGKSALDYAIANKNDNLADALKKAGAKGDK